MYWNRWFWGTGIAKKGPEKEAVLNIKDKCNKIADKCGKVLKPGSGKKGQSSKDPHGRRTARESQQANQQPGQAPSDGEPSCEVCGYEPAQSIPKQGKPNKVNKVNKVSRPNKVKSNSKKRIKRAEITEDVCRHIEKGCNEISDCVRDGLARRDPREGRDCLAIPLP